MKIHVLVVAACIAAATSFTCPPGQLCCNQFDSTIGNGASVAPVNNPKACGESNPGTTCLTYTYTSSVNGQKSGFSHGDCATTTTDCNALKTTVEAFKPENWQCHTVSAARFVGRTREKKKSRDD